MTPPTHGDGRDTRDNALAAPLHRGKPLVLWLLSGFIVWFVALCVLYGLHAVGCDLRWPHARNIALLAVLLLAACASLAGLWLWQPWRAAPAPFARRAVAWSLLAAAVSTVAVLGPPLLLTPCAP
ncbi:MAG: hypothetical protein Q4G71_02960 [Pseudomonadota bacterium]|nr:hypothetical protein [Pseudomonadota bacterium]